MPEPDAAVAELAEWRAKRLAELCAEDGWLNLTDRVDLAQGAQTVGSGAGVDVQISIGPPVLGRLELLGDAASFRPEGWAGKPPLLFTPVPDGPPRLILDRLLLEIHTVEGQAALRVRDRQSPARSGFPGLRHFPADPAWRILARWTALPAPQTRDIGMVGGHSATVSVSHVASFSHAGRQITLVPTHVKAGKPMFVFRDQTSQTETYPASRFLFGQAVGSDEIILDFNRAFNPPCAFTDLAICPLPPPENILPFRIEAGELRP